MSKRWNLLGLFGAAALAVAMIVPATAVAKGPPGGDFVSLQPNASGAMAMSLSLTSCGAWNGMLLQILVYSSGNAYLDNDWAK